MLNDTVLFICVTAWKQKISMSVHEALGIVIPSYWCPYRTRNIA